MIDATVEEARLVMCYVPDEKRRIGAITIETDRENVGRARMPYDTVADVLMARSEFATEIAGWIVPVRILRCEDDMAVLLTDCHDVLKFWPRVPGETAVERRGQVNIRREQLSAGEAGQTNGIRRDLLITVMC